MSPKSATLDEIERWMQAVLMQPGGVEEGLSSAGAVEHLRLSASELEEVISRSRAQRRLVISSADKPCLRSSAMYSLLNSVPSDGGFMGCSLVAAVMNTRVPHTTGDDQPTPGTSATHSTFSVLDHLTGRLALSETGFESGPRKRGQYTGVGAVGWSPISAARPMAAIALILALVSHEPRR